MLPVLEMGPLALLVAPEDGSGGYPRTGDPLDYSQRDRGTPWCPARACTAHPVSPPLSTPGGEGSHDPTSLAHLKQVVWEGIPCPPLAPRILSLGPCPVTLPAHHLSQLNNILYWSARTRPPSSPPQRQAGGAAAVSRGWGAPGGQPAVHSGSTAPWEYELAAPPWSREQGHVCGTVHGIS